MIIVDVETTGLDPKLNSIVSIGAVDLNSSREFYVECKVEPGTEKNISNIALSINGFTHEQIFDDKKMLPIEAVKKFILFSAQNTLLGGQQVGSFDALFIKHIADKYGLHWPFSRRTVDLHSVAFYVTSKSMSLDDILTHVNLPKEPKPHNALVGAKLEKEAFIRLKSLLIDKKNF